MKKVTYLLHKIVKLLTCEETIVRLSKSFPFFMKFIPLHTFYEKSDSRIVLRDGVTFNIDLYDYMQWYIFADIKEQAWEIAAAIAKQQQGIVLDIGCNVGAFSLKLANKLADSVGVKIEAFDPNPFVHKKFLKNLELNEKLKTLININNIALGSENKQVDFSFDEVHSGGGSIGQFSSKVVSVSMKTLDDFLSKQKNSKVVFMKVDVEGFEPYVFEGARKTIQNYKPVLFFEVTEQWHQKFGCSSKQIFNFLADLNYKFYEEIDGKLQTINDPFERASNTLQINIYAFVDSLIPNKFYAK